MLMNFKIDYMGVCVVIDTNTEKITIIENNNNSKKLFNMIFKAILNSINIDCSGYTVVNKTNS